MKKTASLLILWGFTMSLAFSQEHTRLHLSSEWKECSFQLDPSLTQDAWHRFAKEAGMVSYFRPLSSADPMGRGKLDISVLQWKTRIDENSEAWNNTFVHPDTAHWLIDGQRLPIPGLSLRAGISERIDVGVYWTTNPKANYSIAGALLQYNLLQDKKGWSAASRLNWSSIYGPRDLTFSNYGIDLLGSKRFSIWSDRASITPYASVSAVVSRAHERTEAVSLKDETVLGFQGSIGAVARISLFELAAEYNQGITHTLSLRLGVSFGLFQKQSKKG